MVKIYPRFEASAIIIEEASAPPRSLPLAHARITATAEKIFFCIVLESEINSVEQSFELSEIVGEESQTFASTAEVIQYLTTPPTPSADTAQTINRNSGALGVTPFLIAPAEADRKSLTIKNTTNRDLYISAQAASPSTKYILVVPTGNAASITNFAELKTSAELWGAFTQNPNSGGIFVTSFYN